MWYGNPHIRCASERTLNNVAAPMALWSVEVSFILLREKPLYFSCRKIFYQVSQTYHPLLSLLSDVQGMTCALFTMSLQFPQKLTVILQKLFQGNAILTFSSTEVIVLILESCGCLVTSPVSPRFQEYSLAEKPVFQTAKFGMRCLC